jgi:electron transfer flavoprotein beta subunit
LGYDIAVCIKPVPDPKYYDKIKIHPVKKTIIREGIPTIINPSDKHAIEAALRIKEEFGGKVITITMAPMSSQENIREALAMGADEAYLLSNRMFAGSDTLATSYVLAQGLKKIGKFDFIFTGNESADGATSQVPGQIAEWLNIPHLCNVREFHFTKDKKVEAKIKIEGGYIEYLTTIPVLFSVSREVNKPRYTTIKGVIRARQKPINIFTVRDLELDNKYIGLKGSPTQPGEIYIPSIGRNGEKLKGDPRKIAIQILDRIRSVGVNFGKSK